MRKILYIFALVAILASCNKEKTLCIISTGDIHGSIFRDPYVDGQDIKSNLMSVKSYVDTMKMEYGKNNVLLIDTGDFLQGDNSVYYYNYEDTETTHLYSRIADYMGYDAVTLGNHDIETGHSVYDRVAKELKRFGVTPLAGNAVRTEDGKPYFPLYKKFRKAGMNVIVFGFTNSAIKYWLSEDLWSGMDFINLSTSYVQGEIDKVLAKEKADVVIVSVHSGTGKGDGSELENQALDLLYGLKGVDFILCGHDHTKTVIEHHGSYLVNCANKAGIVGNSKVVIKDGVKKLSAQVTTLDNNRIDEKMQQLFEPDFQKVRNFTNRYIGELTIELRSRDAFAGMSPYLNFLHTVMLRAKEAKISFAAPLSSHGVVKAGKIVFNDLFTIYPFENALFVINLRGKEIKDYLEYSYNTWVKDDDYHTLRIINEDARWKLEYPSYNFESAAGLNYTVDPKKPYGQRVVITSLADGTPFDEDAIYPVATNSYRVNGGGKLMLEGAHLTKEEVDSRIIARYPDIREMVGDFFREEKIITEELISNPEKLGHWNFVPEDVVPAKINSDLRYIYR